MTDLTNIAKEHLEQLCLKIDNRCVGSQGNLLATRYFEENLISNSWDIEHQEFEVFDWNAEKVNLKINGCDFYPTISPYSICCDVVGELAAVSSINDLQNRNLSDKILCVSGELTKEPLMPKNFVFYNPDHHKKLVSLLERSCAKAIIFIVNEQGVHDGGEYPFPIIEDGDFEVPSVFLSEQEGNDILSSIGSQVHLCSKASRIPSKGYNIIGRKGKGSKKRLVLTAHIDSKKGTPGAIDNATGIVTLLLVSEILSEYESQLPIELVALNGEDYYSVPGQMTYINNNQGKFENIGLNINIDGAGLKKGRTSFSFFNLPPDIEEHAGLVVNNYQGITEGRQWIQGDHSIFLQYGVPAIAISSEWLIDNLAHQEITHTPEDSPEKVSLEKIVELSKAICDLIYRLQGATFSG